MPRPSDLAYWQSVHNTHLGERCFVLALGPSLKEVDISPLASEFTFGITFLYRWEGLHFRPNVWIANEIDHYYKIAEHIADWDILKVLVAGQSPDRDRSWRWLYKDSRAGYSGDPYRWEGQDDLLGLGDEFWRGPTCYSAVPDAAIPIAFWMGFQEVYLLGVDHTVDGYIYDPEFERSAQVIRNVNKAYTNMLPVVKKYGRKLLNCSPNSLAPVPHMSLSDVLGDGDPDFT